MNSSTAANASSTQGFGELGPRVHAQARPHDGRRRY